MEKILFTNGNIITLDENENIYEEMLIEGNVIKKLGSRGKLKDSEDKEVQMIDLHGKTVVPGFFESHIHLVEAGRTLIDLDLKNVKSFDEFKEKLIKFNFESKEKWILGSGWNEMNIFWGNMPNRLILDKIVLNKPVALSRGDGHSIVLNTRAIEILNLEKICAKGTKMCPVFEDGTLEGMFYEEQTLIIHDLISKNLSKEYFKQAVKKANYELISNGVTSINDIVTGYPQRFFMYKEMIKSSDLNVRVFSAPYGESKMSKLSFKFLKRFANDKINIGPAKYFLDGSFGSKSALLFEGYENDEENFGIQTMAEENLREVIRYSLKKNSPIAVHAIGDKAVNKLLNEYEKLYENYPNKNVRNRIEHIQIIKENDIERFKELNIIASFQPVFNLEKDLTLDRVGARRIGDTYRYKTFMDKGVRVIFNSDWPFGGGPYPKKEDGFYFKGFEPLLGMHCSVNPINLNTNERTSVLQALKCYTINPAYANYEDDKLGTIEKGKLADFTVLDENIINVDISKLKDIKVLMTVADGKIVFER